MNFCVAILILKMKENALFHHVMLYYFMKGKNTLKQNKRSVRRVEKVLWLMARVKSGFPHSCWRFLTGRCSTVRETSWSWQRSNRGTNWEQSTWYHVGDSWHTQSIQINKVIDENEKCVFCFTENTETDFLANPIHSLVQSQSSYWGADLGWVAYRETAVGAHRLGRLLGLSASLHCFLSFPHADHSHRLS